MRIAVLSNYYPLTTHTFIRREIQGLEAAGLEVERFTIRRTTEPLPEIEDQEEAERTSALLDGGFVSLLRAVVARGLRSPLLWIKALSATIRYDVTSHRGLIRHFAYFAEACVLRQELAEKKVEHVHVHFGTNACMVVLLSRLLGGPRFSVQIHGPGEFDNPRELHIPEKIAAAAFATSITEFARGQIYRWTDPEHWKKVHVIRCGVDQRFLDDPIEPIPERPRLVCIGRFGRSKGHPILLEAAARLRDRGVDFEIELIGDGELRPMIEALVSDYQLERHIILSGWKDGDGVRDALINSRGLVLPSFGEGLPVVIMESFALGRPVIATRIAGISELVEDGRNGWVINSSSVDGLTEAMHDAFTAPIDRLEAFGVAGREAASERHDSRTEANKLAKLLLATQGDGDARIR
ncbi:MAG: glycosyltransferase family 4 protein [Myxococcota bacterium]